MLEQLVLDMFDHNIIKFGEFTLKSGKKSSIYLDLRSTISYPKIYRQICDLLYLQMQNLKHDFICGIPYSALTFASSIGYTHNIPMILKRKETKDHGTKKILEGHFTTGQTCILIEDTVTTALSIVETITPMRESGLIVTDVICLIDRNQGSHENLARNNCRLHSVLTLLDIVNILYNKQKITLNDKNTALSFLT